MQLWNSRVETININKHSQNSTNHCKELWSPLQKWNLGIINMVQASIQLNAIIPPPKNPFERDWKDWPQRVA